MTKLKKIVAVALIALTVAGVFAGCEKKTTSFVVGLDDEFPPMAFRDENNEIVGFDVDLAKEVGKRLGVEVTLQPIDWSTKELELNSGRIDLIWNGLTITPQRKEEMLISRPYLANNQVLMVKADSGYTKKSDLEGKNIGVQTGSSAEIALAADTLGSKVKVTQFTNNVMAMQDLKIGRLDAVVLDEIVARYYLTKEEGFVMLEDSLAAEEYGIAFKKGNTELHDKVMKAFDEMIADGTAAAISEKWFGKDIILLSNNQVLMVKADSGYTKKSDLEGKNIGVQAGSSAEAALANELGSKVTVIQFSNNDLAMQDLKSGRIDAVALDEIIARHYLTKEKGTFKQLDESLVTE